MALSFSGLGPVAFGGKTCQPKINAEQKLRLGQLKQIDETADEVMAACFPDDYAYVREFLRDKMTDFEKQMLNAYLLGGESMLRMIEEQIKNGVTNKEGDGEND